MLRFFRNKSRNKLLDDAICKIQMNMENNYKDAAQINLKEFEECFRDLETAGKLNESQKAYYEEQLGELQKRLKHFTHQDQKPYWVGTK